MPWESHGLQPWEEVSLLFLFGTDGLCHYRAVYASPDGSYKMFMLVPGATLVGETVRERVRITTTVTFGESTFEYVRVAGDRTGRLVLGHGGISRPVLRRGRDRGRRRGCGGDRCDDHPRVVPRPALGAPGEWTT